MKKLFISTAILALLASCTNKEAKNESTEEVKTENTISNEKIVSLNGAITEILADLGEENNLVGVDVTSTYPASVKEKATDLGQTEIIKQDYSVEGTKKLVKTVATSLNKQDFDAITTKIDTDLKAVKPLATKPKVLFIYARGAGNLMVAGTNTPMEKIIGIAGGQNAITEFEDFKPLTPEAVVKSNPDYILMFDKGLESIGGVDGVLKLEGVASTNAGKNKKIIAMDGQLVSGFGPRVGQAAAKLNQLLQK